MSWIAVVFLLWPLTVSAGDYFWPGTNGVSIQTGPRVNFSSPAWHWREDVQVMRAGPLIDDKQNIYQTTVVGHVYKFNSQGLQLWRYKARAMIPGGAYLYQGALYALVKPSKLKGGGCHLMALDMETGTERWRVKLGNALHAAEAPLLISQGVVVVGVAMGRPLGRGELPSSNNLVLGVSAVDGSLRWRFSPDSSVNNLLVSAQADRIVFMDHSGVVYRLSLTDGALIWKTGVHTRTISTGAAVLGDNDVVYAVSNAMMDSTLSGVIHAYRLSDGQLLWKRFTGDFEGNQAPAVGYLKKTSEGEARPSVVAALGPRPGHPVQMKATGTVLIWAPWFLLVLDMELVFRAMQQIPEHILEWFFPPTEYRGRLVALDAETGETQWTFTPPPWVHDSGNGESRRLKPRNNVYTNELLCVPSSWSAPTISADGTVYAGFMDGKLYAVHGDANNDGKITDGEYSMFDAGDAWSGSVAMAPGLLVAAPCGGGIYAFAALQ